MNPVLKCESSSALGYSHGWNVKASISHGIMQYARKQILSALQIGVQKGQLLIEEADGPSTLFGNEIENRAPVSVKIVSNDFWCKLFYSLDMGLSEAYMEGDFETPSLKELFDLWLDNRDTLGGLNTSVNALYALCTTAWIRVFGHSLSESATSVTLAYDVSNVFFKAFLSKEMLYSCALWGDEENGVRGDLAVGSKDGDLESAQERKIRHVLSLARLRPGDRLLEIGSGWGAIAIEAARLGYTVDTVTLSVRQKEETEERANLAGVADKVRVHLCDYRDIPQSFEKSFDAFISLEMVEAVGPENLHKYFGMIDRALKPGRGTAVITATAQPEFRHSDYQPDDFARRYHWPNCVLPSASSFISEAQKTFRGRMVLSRLEDWGPHYPRTLREWARRFEANLTKPVIEDIASANPQLSDRRFVEAFKAKWRYMFAYAEAGYARAYTSLNCWTFARPENVEIRCD